MNRWCYVLMYITTKERTLASYRASSRTDPSPLIHWRAPTCEPRASIAGPLAVTFGRGILIVHVPVKGNRRAHEVFRQAE